jgi:hypothetical protein
VRRRGWPFVAALCIYVTAAVAASWPLTRRATGSVVSDLGDPVFAATVLGWDADRMLHGFRGFWDAPFLFPTARALAHAEHLLGIALFVAPIEWLWRNPILAYNLAYLFTYVLAGVGMFLLVRSLWGRWDAALLAGLAFELTQYRFEESSHIQVLANGWMPVGLWGLHRYFETGRRGWVALFAAGFLLTGLSNGYYFYFFLVPILTLVAFEFVRPRVPRATMVRDLLAATAAVAVCAAPFALAYLGLRTRGGFERSQAEIDHFGARLADYLHVTPGAWSWGGQLVAGPAERNLFPGFVMIAFAAVGLFRARRRETVAYLVIATLAVWLSMGSHGGPLYGWLFRTVPGFNALRVPARLAAVTIMAVSVLAGGGFGWVLSRLGTVQRTLFVVAAAAAIALEGQRGVRIVAVPTAEPRSWNRVAYDWLAAQPGGAVLELPVNRAADFRPETSTLYQLETLRHHHPIVNGLSGWGSPLQELLGNGSSPLADSAHVGSALKALRSVGIRYVLLHERTFRDRDEANRLAADIRGAGDVVAEQHRFETTWAWRLADAPAPGAPATRGDFSRLEPASYALAASNNPERLRLAVDGDIDTRWLSGSPQQGNEWIELRFAQPTDVARIELDNAERSAVDYPRHLVVESVDSDGAARAMFDGSVVDQVILGVVAADPRGTVAIDLPPSRSSALRLRQTGHAPAWWSVHELQVWRRGPRD